MKIYFLLTNYPDKLSVAIRRLGRWRYSHVSISADCLDGDFFSYTGKRGFITEQPKLHPKYKGEEILCSLYLLEVPEELGRRIVQKILAHREKAANYRYSYFGLAMMYLKIHAHFPKENTCSGFVADIMRESGCFSKKFCRRLVSPNDFYRHLSAYKQYEGSLHKLVKKAF